jgi:hypothetical protein
MRTLLTLSAAAVLLAAAGCRKQVSHQTVRSKVANYEAAVDIACGVIDDHFKVIRKREKRSDGTWLIESDYMTETLDMGRRTRRFCRTTVTPIDDYEVDVLVHCLEQRDTSETGYGTNSADAQWSTETHDSELERKILEEIQYALDKAEEAR